MKKKGSTRRKNLTPLQLGLMEKLSKDGKTNVEIGKIVCVSEASVRYHLKKLRTAQAEEVEHAMHADVVNIMRSETLKSNAIKVAERLAKDEKDLGCTHKELRLRLEIGEYLNRTAVMFQATGEPDPMRTTDENRIVADIMVADLSHEQMVAKLELIDTARGKKPIDNLKASGGIIS